jgi:hypothetical protein
MVLIGHEAEQFLLLFYYLAFIKVIAIDYLVSITSVPLRTTPFGEHYFGCCFDVLL